VIFATAAVDDARRCAPPLQAAARHPAWLARSGARATAAALLVSLTLTMGVQVHAGPAAVQRAGGAPDVGRQAAAGRRPLAALQDTGSPGPIRVGDVVVLTIASDVPRSGLRVRAFDRSWLPYAIDALTWRVLVGVDLETKPGVFPVEIEAESPDLARTTQVLTVHARNFRTRVLTVDEALVTPPAEARPRIAREAARLDQLWATRTETRLWTGPFVRPVPDAANSAFGTRSVYNGQPRSPHSGTDFLSPEGQPIKAPNAGRVVLAESLYFTGGTVVIDHGLGLLSLFAHLSVIDVHEGDPVEAGAVIGQVGATGRVTGPHLHWSVRAGGARVDPLSLLAALGAAPPGRGRRRPAGTANERRGLSRSQGL
jgi:murein DD-endopeptidase MepM/ murein hydrolase activator NlpD